MHYPQLEYLHSVPTDALPAQSGQPVLPSVGGRQPDNPSQDVLPMAGAPRVEAGDHPDLRDAVFGTGPKKQSSSATSSDNRCASDARQHDKAINSRRREKGRTESGATRKGS